MWNRALQYLLYFVVWISSEAFSMWGQFSTLKYPNMGMVEAFLRVIPFAWADWGLTTVAVWLADTYGLMTPTQDTFVMIIVQFAMILIINKLWLKQVVTRSDIAAFVMILVAFYVSFTQAASKLLGRKVQKKPKGRKKRR